MYVVCMCYIIIYHYAIPDPEWNKIKWNSNGLPIHKLLTKHALYHTWEMGGGKKQKKNNYIRVVIENELF